MSERVWSNGLSTLYHADAHVMPLPDESVHCVVTSPPYWGLRDYGLDDWEGGDAECAHTTDQKRGARTLDPNSKQATNVASLQTPEGAGGVCAKCGAHRKSAGIGLEPTLSEWVGNIVAVSREIYRVMRDDGTWWLNLGDAYVGSGKGMNADGTHSYGDIQSTNRGSTHLPVRGKRMGRGQGSGRWGGGDQRVDGLPTKNLMLQPARVALALQQPWWTCTECEETNHQSAFGYWPDGRLICPVCLETHNVRLAQPGWIVRSAPIWHKTNAMPESARDRPSSAYEQIYLLVKSNKPIYWVHEDGAVVFRQPLPDYRWIHEDTEERTDTPPPGWSRDDKMGWERVNLWAGVGYFYDGDAVRTPPNPDSWARYQRNSQYDTAELIDHPHRIRVGPTGAGFDRRAVISDTKYDQTKHNAGRLALLRQAARVQGIEYAGIGANLRDVWRFSTKGRNEKHYATFPEELPRLCILAGTSEHGVCADCGAPWRREVARTLAPTENAHEKLTMPKGSDGASVRGDGMAVSGFRPGMVGVAQTIGWKATCECDAERVPATVLDPFAGLGTTLAVAQSLGRRSIGVDLKREYLEMARKRLAGVNLPLPLGE